jgi:hypothetical protein
MYSRAITGFYGPSILQAILQATDSQPDNTDDVNNEQAQ